MGSVYIAGDRIEHEGEVGEGLRRARQALVSGKPGKAMSIFTQYIAGWPSFLGNFAGALTALFPAYRRLIPCQIDDLEAMERLGVRLDAYARLNVPVAMVCGERTIEFLCCAHFVRVIAFALYLGKYEGDIAKY